MRGVAEEPWGEGRACFLFVDELGRLHQTFKSPDVQKQSVQASSQSLPGFRL
jgi:hypothetical protein